MLQQMFQKCEVLTRIKSCLKRINKRDEIAHSKPGDRGQMCGGADDKRTKLKLRMSESFKAPKQEVFSTESEFISDLESLLVDFHSFMIQNSIEMLFQKVPETGQFLGKLCTLPEVTSRENMFKLLMKCILLLYRQNPKNAVEKRAKEWVLSLIRMCSLPTSCDIDLPPDLSLTESKKSKQVLLTIRELITRKIDDCHGCVKKRDMFDTSNVTCHHISDIVGVATLMLDKWRNMPEISDLWNKILEVLSKHSDDPAVLIFFNNLMESDVDITSEGGFFSHKSLKVLWSSYSPALEKEVFTFVEDMSRILPDKEKLQQKVGHHTLVQVCSRDSEILLKTNQILFTLFKDTNCCAVFLEILSVFMACLRQKQYSDTSGQCLSSVLMLYPENLWCMCTCFQLSPKDMKITDIVSQVSKVVLCLKDLYTSTGEQDRLWVWYCLNHYREWYYKVMEVILLADKQVLNTFLDFIQFFNIPEPKAHNHFKEYFHAIILGLRGLLGKSQLRFEDVKYVIQSGGGKHMQEQHRSLFSLIMVSFLCQSISGLQYIGQVFMSLTPVEKLHHLVTAYYILGLSRQCPPYKCQVYAEFLQEAVTVVINEQSPSSRLSQEKSWLLDQQTNLINIAKHIIQETVK